jgi:hypothetical protein
MRRIPRLLPLCATLLLSAALPPSANAYVFYDDSVTVTVDWFTVLWRTNRHVEFPDDITASIRQSLVPVFDTPCDEAARLPIVVAPDGTLVAMFKPARPSGAVLAPSVRQNAFLPAKIAAEPAWGLITARPECYYVRREAAVEGDTLPECRFRMDVQAMQSLLVLMAGSDADDSPKRTGPTRAVVDLDIDKDGAISAMKGADKAGEILVLGYLRKIRKDMTFTPATRKGEPVPAKLRLVVRAGEKSGVPEIAYHDEAAFEMTLPGPWQKPSLEVTAYLEYNGDGTVDTVRLPGNLDKATAVALLRGLSLTMNRVVFTPYDDVPTAKVRLRLEEGTNVVKLISPPARVSIASLAMPKWSDIIFDDLPIEGVMKVSLLIQTDANGQLSDVLVQDTNLRLFANRIATLVRKKSLAEASFDGRPSRSVTTLLLRLYPSKKPIKSENW